MTKPLSRLEIRFISEVSNRLHRVWKCDGEKWQGSLEIEILPASLSLEESHFSRTSYLLSMRSTRSGMLLLLHTYIYVHHYSRAKYITSSHRTLRNELLLRERVETCSTTCNQKFPLYLYVYIFFLRYSSFSLYF